MQGSVTFRPGDVNIPLPRSCGAVFAPSGQLLTFFPPKPRSIPERENDIEGPDPQADSYDTDRNAHLFPSFGNLSANRMSQVDNDLDGDDEGLTGARAFRKSSSLSMPAGSFQSQHSWKAKASPTKPAHSPVPGLVKVTVGVYAVDALLQSHRSVAEAYRILRETGESGESVCRHNAVVAESAGLQTTANIWQLLAVILEDKVPLELLNGDRGDESVLVTAHQVASLRRIDSGVDLTESGQSAAFQGKLRWSDHPLGAAWLVNKVLEFAERNADIQLLAYASAIVAGDQSKHNRNGLTRDDSMAAKLASFGLDYESYLPPTNRQALRIRPVTILRTDSSPINPIFTSPTKLRQISQLSSRTPSQPSSPFPEPSTTTSPLPFPAFSRHGSRLSTSGSGSPSPEHHRSSFSAAAKHYAQSITDKFASYGTSPPVRKTGGSPSTQELSSSFPTQSGSWSKSVSFSSAIESGRESQLSKSYTSVEDGYDSDKTIDDTSQPATPRSKNAEISVEIKSHDFFSDDQSGCARAPLLASDLAAKAARWRQVYAEQLRCWGLIIQATELEKVSGLSDTGGARSTRTLHGQYDGMVPARGPSRRKGVCSICSCVAERLGLLCPACLHVQHPQCLEEYVCALDGEMFECPAGCGCTCAGVVPDFPEVRTGSKDDVKLVVEKASYTDWAHIGDWR